MLVNLGWGPVQSRPTRDPAGFSAWELEVLAAASRRFWLSRFGPSSKMGNTACRSAEPEHDLVEVEIAWQSHGAQGANFLTGVQLGVEFDSRWISGLPLKVGTEQLCLDRGSFNENDLYSVAWRSSRCVWNELHNLATIAFNVRDPLQAVALTGRACYRCAVLRVHTTDLAKYALPSAELL